MLNGWNWFAGEREEEQRTKKMKWTFAMGLRRERLIIHAAWFRCAKVKQGFGSICQIFESFKENRDDWLIVIWQFDHRKIFD